ncbi:hypothetical protein AT959_02030 [Dechloromonas denitrificans]|uniref:DUF2802 domain-containing protein n=1 Tax=Dechloromonas denitrificans TaxID=281362 RepID=A0A133XNH5_9RHOO|nr:DUF2802 domain-containing protein [Dechloromonas denitrificans]KXB32488.1 hypothetical protein AT959_02030 [Dechloromonas denitrificans]
MELAGVTLGLREAVIGLITLVACYIIFVLLRMYRLHSRAGQVAVPREPIPAPVEPAVPPEVPAAVEPDRAASDDWERASRGMADEMLRHSLEQEFDQLRDEVDAMRGELAALRTDMQQELAHLRAAQTVSPIYGDAMQMAAAGYEPAMIAERCGIARAEAELVVALAKSQERGG